MRHIDEEFAARSMFGGLTASGAHTFARGQLTAGIAREIKNPLNFINNFSALSVELVDEQDDALKPAALDNKTRKETDELTHILKGNLEKVVQHSKRADSIVKNMLLHSREGSGELRTVDPNNIVEDSLNLEYHGARAENQEFKIKLERSFDPAAGEADLFPQEITRVLLNLISSGFYAAMKRKAEMRDGYEPALAAATRDLGDRVEISIRDNGSGIPPDVKDKMFDPFFTTKPPGEGTGLGLSLSHDIVVKQHAGSIEVDTRPGEFTEFRIIRPRTAATSKAGATTHTVMVLDEGFALDGRTYKSLSAIAKAITGTNWNGYAFFGIKRAARSNKAATGSKRKSGLVNQRDSEGDARVPSQNSNEGESRA